MLAKRSLGQHFLVSAAVVSRILEAARFMAATAAGIVEVGPGGGALTEGLSGLGKSLWLVEKDDALAESLAERFPGALVTAGDARALDWCSLPRVSGRHPWCLVANLPYNAGTEILRQALARREVFMGALVMLQKEVAHKFCADADGEGYGPLSVWTEPWWERRMLFTVPPGAFSPRPKVTSAVCSFRARPQPLLPSASQEAFWAFVNRAFKQPRKTLAGNLGGGGIAGRLAERGYPFLARPAAVAPEDYVWLFRQDGAFEGNWGLGD